MSVVVYEARKTLPDAIAEVREAIDFLPLLCSAGKQQLTDNPLLGPTGESNQLRMHGRGVFMYQPMEFSISDFHWPSGCGASRRNAGISETCRANLTYCC